MTITRKALAHAAANGQALSHLTAGQAWAAHKLCVPPERLQKPLASHIGAILENVERKARREFFGGVTTNDTDEMISRAYDQQHPPFLRLPILETLKEGMDKFFLGLKPAGYDDSGEAVYALADLAHALEVSEAELLQHTDQRELTDRIQRQTVHCMH